MAEMWFNPKIPQLLSEIKETYTEKSKFVDKKWDIDEVLFSQKFYDSLPNNMEPIELMNTFLDFLNSPTEENEKILNVLFEEICKASYILDEQSGDFIADEQPQEYVAVRERQ